MRHRENNKKHQHKNQQQQQSQPSSTSVDHINTSTSSSSNINKKDLMPSTKNNKNNQVPNSSTPLMSDHDLNSSSPAPTSISSSSTAENTISKNQINDINKNSPPQISSTTTSARTTANVSVQGSSSSRTNSVDSSSATNNKQSQQKPRRRVAIIGGGAAGMACAFSLAKSNNPSLDSENVNKSCCSSCNCRCSSDDREMNTVVLFEPASELGGVAMTTMIDSTGHSNNNNNDDDENIEKKKIPLNIGVQGGAESYRNIMNLHDYCGCKPRSDAPLHVSFGKGEKFNWTNQSDGPLLKSMREETARFGKFLTWVHRLEPFSVFVPIYPTLKFFGFSQEFIERLVIPLVALFFGTGNQTADVSAAIIARVFHDSKLRLFDFDPDRLLAQQPKMFSFPPLEEVYKNIRNKIESFDDQHSSELLPSEKHEFRTGTKVTKVKRLSDGGVEVTYEDANNNNNNNNTDRKKVERFDAVVFACGAEVALKLLGDSATMMENYVLGNVKYYDDVTYTHTDEEYMKKHYDLSHEGAMYFIHSYAEEPKDIEMSFELNAYQKHIPKETRIFQSIFLDKEGDKKKKLWTDSGIDKDKIIAKTWWRQFSHGAQHFRSVVPFVPLIQGRGNIFHAGSFTLCNTHEIATLSGFACAYRLGSPHPFSHDAGAIDQFNTYLAACHAMYCDVFFGGNYFLFYGLILLILGALGTGIWALVVYA